MLFRNCSFFCLTGVLGDHYRNTVEQVGHTAKEQRTFTDDHSSVNFAFEDVVAANTNVWNAGWNVTLCWSPTNHTVLSWEGSEVFLFEVASLNAQSSDHLVVSKRNVASASRFGDIWVLHFSRVFINVSDLQTSSIQRIGYQRRNNVLWSGTGTNSVFTSVLGAVPPGRAGQLSSFSRKMLGSACRKR